MKQGQTINDLAIQIAKENELKQDFLADTRSVKMTDGRLHFNNTSYEMSNHFHSQVATRLGIPAKYYNLMKDESVSLLEQNVNHWFQEKPEKRMLRTSEGKCRAYLSKHYRILDNYDLLANSILPVIKEKKLNVVSCNVSERKFYMKCTFPELKREIDTSVRKGDVVEAGLVVSNSEIGAGSLQVQPLVYCLVCENGMISDTALKKYHVGRSNVGDFEKLNDLLSYDTKQIVDHGFWMQVRDVINYSISEDIFNTLVDKIANSTKDQIKGNPVTAVEIIQKSNNFTDTQGADILRELTKGGDLSKWGLVNAVTAASKIQEDYEKATEMERVGGKIIELDKKDWETIAEAA